MAEDSIALRRRIESLPQELYDDIYKCTFTATNSTRIIEQRSERRYSGLRKLHWLKQAPNKRWCDGQDTISLLLVDKASHDQFVKSLYGSSGTVFVFKSPPACKIWCSCLKPEYLDMLKDIRCCASSREVAFGVAAHLADTFGNNSALVEKTWMWSERLVLGGLKEFEGETMDDWGGKDAREYAGEVDADEDDKKGESEGEGDEDGESGQSCEDDLEFRLDD